MHKGVKLTSSYLSFQVKIHVTDVQLLCIPLRSFIHFIIYTDGGVSKILVKVTKLFAGIVNPYKRLHGGGCLQISPGPWHSK